MKNVMKIMTALMMVVLFASCGGDKTPTAEEVFNKVQNKETLTQADYTVMIEYVGDYSKKAQEYFNKINASANDNSPEYVKAFNDLSTLYGKYPYLDSFRTALYNVPDGMLDPENQAIVNEFANDEAFPLPKGEGVSLENPDVQGMVQDMPNTAFSDSTGVVSTGIGEAVNE